jgi:ParB family chromosome partitioning protein
MYRRALDEGLYPSMRKLAEAVNVDVSLVSKSVSLARLPEAVVEAFPSPLEIQFRWAQPLSEALQKDPDGTLVRAKALRGGSGKRVAAQVFETLIGRGEPMRTAAPVQISANGKRAATLSTDAQGRAVLRFEPGALADVRRAELAALVERFLNFDGQGG